MKFSVLDGDESAGCFRMLPELGGKLKTAGDMMETELRSYRHMGRMFRDGV